MWEQAKKQQWYQKGGMLGYQWGKERLDELENILNDSRLRKTKIQKFILNNTLNFSETDWHYFNNMSNKDVQLLKHALKKVGKDNVVSELDWIETRSGLLRTPLTKVLHVLAYKLQPEKYLTQQAKVYKFYGMEDEKARQRARDMVTDFENDLKYKWNGIYK